MKKIFLASTAMAFTAGAAYADVTVSGDGRMGVLYNETEVLDAYDEKTNWRFTSRIRIKFAASGETDGGLVFGGSIRADQYSDDEGLRGENGSVFISGGWGKLSMGDVDGGAEVAVGDLAGVGLTGLLDQNENLYLFGANDPSALYEYSYEGLLLTLGISDDREYSAGIGYDGGNWTLGLGYEKLPQGGTVQITIDDQDFDLFPDVNSTLEQLIGGASFTFADITIAGTYGRTSANSGGDFDQYGLSASGTWDAWTGTAYWRRIDGLEGATTADGELIADNQLDAYGIGASYDLGGGASLVAGVASIYEQTVGDFGLSFSF